MGSDWHEEYRRRLTTAEDALTRVKAGDRVAVSTLVEPESLLVALAARLYELQDVKLEWCCPLTDCGWFEPDVDSPFEFLIRTFTSPAVRPLMDAHLADYSPTPFSLHSKAFREGRPGSSPPDVFLVRVSAPDEQGYCSFGSSMWNKKDYTMRSGCTIAQVDSGLIRTAGENSIHVTEFDALVEYEQSPMELPEPEVPENAQPLFDNVGELVRDGDVLQMGAGTLGAAIATTGVFDDRKDLGYHAENNVRGVVELVKKGIMTGARKTLHPGKVVATNMGFYADEHVYMDGNSVFEVYDQEYVININTIAQNDNMVAINSALAVDLTGQVASESIGHRMFTGAGGQPDFCIGALMSKGGRSIMMVPSKDRTGEITRITPAFDPGTVVTVPRHYADFVVSEYGVASLMDKSQRERAQELIAIAAPEFRAELKREAERLF